MLLGVRCKRVSINFGSAILYLADYQAVCCAYHIFLHASDYPGPRGVLSCRSQSNLSCEVAKASCGSDDGFSGVLRLSSVEFSS